MIDKICKAWLIMLVAFAACCILFFIGLALYTAASKCIAGDKELIIQVCFISALLFTVFAACRVFPSHSYEYIPEDEKCPKCDIEMKHASGIGLFCPNKECEVFDDHELHKQQTNILSDESE